jgi:hypothetical protein
MIWFLFLLIEFPWLDMATIKRVALVWAIQIYNFVQIDQIGYAWALKLKLKKRTFLMITWFNQEFALQIYARLLWWEIYWNYEQDLQDYAKLKLLNDRYGEKVMMPWWYLLQISYCQNPNSTQLNWIWG